MLISFITALTLAFFAGGGQDSFFLDPSVEKDVKVYVQDKQRQKGILNIIDEMKADQKAFKKRKHKVYQKQAAELNENYYAKRSDFDAMTKVYLEERLIIQDSIAHKEIRIREIFTQDEWDALIAKLLSDFDKSEVDSSIQHSNADIFNGIKGSCYKVIADTLASKKAIMAITQQELLVNQLFDEYLNLDYYHVEKLRTKDVSLDDFKVVSANINKLRLGILTHYFDLRFELIKNCSEKEWNKLSEDFTDVFIKGKGIKK